MDRLSLTLRLIRIRRSLRQRRFDAGKYPTEPASWITLKSNGEHVPLNEAGQAIGGAGGWATGKDFSKAKSVKSASYAAKIKVARETVASVSAKQEALVKKYKYAIDDIREYRKKKEGLYSSLNRCEMDVTRQKDNLKKLKNEAKILCGKKTYEEMEDEAFKAYAEMKALQKEQKSIDPSSPEWQKKENEVDEAVDRYMEFRAGADTLKKIENGEKDLKKLQKDVRSCKRSIKKLEDEGPGEEARKFETEYGELAKQRDDAILSAYRSPEDCGSAQEVSDYLRARGYFRHENDSAFDGDSRLDISKMTHENATACAGRIEKFMQDYPWMKGIMDGLDCHDFSLDGEDLTGTYGYANGTRVCLAQGYFGDKTNVPDAYHGDAPVKYKKDVDSGYHPKGTNFDSIIDHEFTHAMEKAIQAKLEEKGVDLKGDRVADMIMKRVQVRLYGKYEETREHSVRQQVSRYAAVNQGIDKDGFVNPFYGRNTEFLAEAMAEARCSKEPSAIAICVKEAMDDLMKQVGLM